MSLPIVLLAKRLIHLLDKADNQYALKTIKRRPDNKEIPLNVSLFYFCIYFLRDIWRITDELDEILVFFLHNKN